MGSSRALAADICIVGAGPVGGTLACRLAEAGVPTAVIDRAPLPSMEHPAFDGRAYAIAAGSRNLLERAGLWARLPEPPCPILQIRVTDGRVGQPASPLCLHFAHRELGENAGPFGWMVEARAMRRALNARLRELPMISLFAPTDVTVERSAAGAVAHLANGRTIQCRLIIAAEGRNSTLRRAARIPITSIPYRQTSIVTAISHQFPHHNTALEYFLPTGPFAQLPMSAIPDAEADGAGNVSAIVWTERSDIAERILNLDDSLFGVEIARRLGDHLGPIRPIGRRWKYSLSAMLVHRYTETRLALIGDAAHVIHPIAGQGLNLGFRDAMALADLLIDARRTGADPGSASLLARYQRSRRADNLVMLAVTDGLDRLFSNDIGLLRLTRDLGIAAVHRMPVLKRIFMRQAMGIGGLPGVL